MIHVSASGVTVSPILNLDFSCHIPHPFDRLFGSQAAGGGSGDPSGSGQASAGDSSETGGGEFTEAVYKHIMEVSLLVLKQMIAFAKSLPGFLELQCEDQASLVKGMCWGIYRSFISMSSWGCLFWF